LKKTIICAAAAVIALGGCAASGPIEVPKAEPSPINMPERDQTVGLNAIDEILISGAEIASPQLLAGEGDPLPEVDVPAMTFFNGKAVDVLSAISVATGLPVTYVQEDTKARFSNKQVSVRNMSGKLPKVMEELSNLMGFFYVYEGGTIKVSSEQQFIVPIPPVNSLMTSVPQMVKQLGASQVFLDKSSRTLTYMATRTADKRISAYLKYIRDNKSLIVYDMYIWEVTLSASSAMGIQWNNFNLGFGGIGASTGTTTTGTGASASASARAGSAGISGGSAGATDGGLGTQIVYNGANFSMSLLLKFLSTQGNVTSIAQPRLALVSGDTTSFDDGHSIEYVKRVGAVVGSNTTLSSSETDTIFTGLQLSLAGDESDGTVFTKVNASMGTLIRFNDYPSVDGTVQKLPEQSIQKIDTSVRARSGDTLLLAGISTNRYSRDDSGVPGLANTNLLTSMAKDSTRRELVMVLRPRLVKFKHVGAAAKTPTASN